MHLIRHNGHHERGREVVDRKSHTQLAAHPKGHSSSAAAAAAYHITLYLYVRRPLGFDNWCSYTEMRARLRSKAAAAAAYHITLYLYRLYAVRWALITGVHERRCGHVHEVRRTHS